MTYDTNNKNGVATALGAVVVGAAVGAAAAYLSDKDKREKLMNKTKVVADNAKNKANEIATNAADRAGDALEKAGKTVKSVKSNSDSLVEEISSKANDSIL